MALKQKCCKINLVNVRKIKILLPITLYFPPVMLAECLAIRTTQELNVELL